MDLVRTSRGDDPQTEEQPAQKRARLKDTLANTLTVVDNMQLTNGNGPLLDGRLGPRKLIQR